MAGIKFDITGDNMNVLQSFNEVQSGVKQMQRQVEDSGASIEDMFKRIGAVAGLTFAGVSAKEFVRNVMNVRGEFQKLEVAFTTMLQSEEKAASLMNQLVKTAAITPFDLKGVADGAKQLLAYGIAADEVNDTLVHLGDIAAGLSIPLGDLVYLYGTTMVQGRMFTQDLRQFQGRGIPIADELAKQFGVAKDKVGELVTAGKVGAEQVKKALMDMSSEGGKFGGLMEEQAKTINGQISNIEDAIDVMFNNIGKQNDGIINTGLSGVSTLVENYEAVGKAIASAVAVYGVYKAAIMTVTAMQALQTAGVGALTVAETAHYGWIVLVEKAQKLLNATMLSNPYVLVATAIAGVVAIMMNMKSQQDLINEAEEEYNSKKEEAIAKEEEHKRKIEELLSVAGDEQLSTENRRLALVKLEMQYPSIFKKYDTEAEKLKHILDIKNQIAEIDGKNSVKDKNNELNSVNSDIKDLQNSINSRKTGNSGKYTDNFVGTSTQVLQARLTNLLRKRGELQNSISKEQGKSYLANLTGISNDDLQKQINERRNLLAKMQTTEKKYGRVQAGGAKGTYSADELQGQLQILEAEQNKRNEAKYTPAQQKAMAKKALDEAKKALADFDNSTTKYTTAEAEEARKKLTDAVSEAEKEYKKFGGKTGGKKTDPAKTLKQEQRYTDLEAELERKVSRDVIDLEHSTRQAEIDAMEEGSKKTIAQIRLDYDRRKEEIDRGYEDLRIRKIEDARKLWEANPANKDKVFDETTVDASYTDAERKNYEALLKANETELARSLKAQTDMEKQALRDYMKEYGSLQDQRAAITAEYDKKIADTNDTIQKAALQKQKENALKELDFKELQQSINWEVVFNDLDKLSTSSLKDLKEKLKAALDANDITPENAKVLSEKILETENLISDKTNIWGSMIPALRERQRLVNEVKNSEEQIANAQKRQIEAFSQATQAKDNLQSMAKMYIGRNLTREEFNAQSGADLVNLLNVSLDAFGVKINLTGDAAKKLAEAFDKNKIATTDLTKAQEELTDAQKNGQYVNDLLKQMTGKGANGQNFGSALTSIFKNAAASNGGGFMGYASLIQQNVNSMADFTDKIGLAATDFGDAVHGLSDGVNGFMSATQSLASGDVFGAVNGVIDGLVGFGKSLTAVFGINWSGGNEEEHAKTEEELITANEGLQRSIDKLREAFNNANGIRAIELSEDIIKKQQEFNDNVMARWENDMRYHSAHHSNDANWEGFTSEQISRMNALLSRMDSLYGDAKDRSGNTARINSSSWRELSNLTPEALEYIRAYLPDVWDFITSRGEYSWVYDSLNEYADLSGKIAEQTKALAENLTQLSESSLHDQFLSELMDMDKKAKDFGDDFTNILAKAVLNAQIGDLMDEDLKKWRENLAEMMKKEGGLTKEDVAALRDQWDSIVQSGLEARDVMANITGYAKYEQEASSKGFQAMGQDLGAELNGRFTAVQIAGENISSQMLVVVATLNSIASFNQSSNTAVIEIRDMLIFTNSYLEDVVRYAKLLYSEFGGKLDDIVNNTKKL